MPRQEFLRSDTIVVIAAVAGEPNLVEITADGAPPLRLPMGPMPEARRQELLVARRTTAAQGETPLARLVLDIRSPELHAFPWEQWLAPETEAARFDAVVRVTSVPARVTQVTFTPPLRILVCDAPRSERMLDEIRSVFGGRTPERDLRVAKAYLGAAMPSSKLAGAEAVPLGWPVVDVLHLGHLPLANSFEAQLSPDAAERGSLGWLARALHAWQTRLLVIDVKDPDEAALARRLAAALVARAGPAVIVREAHEETLPLYDRLIHDRPLDALTSRRQVTGLPRPRIDSVYGGGGREDLARVSATAEALRELHRTLAPSSAKPPPPLVQGLDKNADAATSIGQLVKDYEGWTFNLHESDGLIPMSQSLDDIRNATGGILNASRRRNRRSKPRHVNANLWKPGPERVDPHFELLQTGNLYELRLQIGPRDRLVPVYETSVFKEIPRIHGQKGVWLEVAVNGLGFDVEGDSVQDLWLPFGEPSDELRFAVRPTQAGAAVLRYTLHYRQNVVQSFRLAALTRQPGADDTAMQSDWRTRRLAEALHVSPDKLPDVTWITKLDYEVAAIAEAASLPERRLAIVANHTLDDRWITVKGSTFQFDSSPAGVNPLVSATRDQLFEGSVRKITPAREDWVCSFGSNLTKNESNLREVLPKLALAGWQMYDSVFSARQRKEMQENLKAPDAMITVAHALLNEVVPWAAMYDRPLYPPAPGGRLEVCTAALPAADGSLPVKACRESGHCLLNQGQSEDKVACPLHFWGFKHLIEIPPRQVDGLRAATSAPGLTAKPTVSAVAAPVGSALVAPHLSAALNAAIQTAAEHEKGLRAMKTIQGRPVMWQQIELAPDALLKAINDPALDLVYLYCHARGGFGDPAKTVPPLLEFSDGKKPTSNTCTYTPDRFQFVWDRRPLVIVNGCSTAVFTPDALSPFVQKFYRDCEAGGVIGTEIPVHEWLATDFAQRFLAHVLDHEPVGHALLAVRRELLAQSNPLGLAYTFYGFSEMKVGDGA